MVMDYRNKVWTAILKLLIEKQKEKIHSRNEKDFLRTKTVFAQLTDMSPELHIDYDSYAWHIHRMSSKKLVEITRNDYIFVIEAGIEYYEDQLKGFREKAWEKLKSPDRFAGVVYTVGTVVIGAMLTLFITRCGQTPKQPPVQVILPPEISQKVDKAPAPSFVETNTSAINTPAP